MRQSVLSTSLEGRQPRALADVAADRLETLLSAAGFGPQVRTNLDVFRRLVQGWGEKPVEAYGAWPSEISDDHTPIELSVALGERATEVRALLEPQATSPTLDAYRKAALAFHARLESEFGACLDRFEKVRGLFVFRGMAGPFAVWNSAVFRPDGTQLYKSYLNPQAHGRAHSVQVVREALSRLGFKPAWVQFEQTALARGNELDELKYFALDLSNGPEARVKVYVRHHGCTAAQLERVCASGRSYERGEVEGFVRNMTGGADRLLPRAAFSCHAFVGGDSRPASVTVYVPVCAYGSDDAAVQGRIRAYMHQCGLPVATYDAILREYANRTLAIGTGMQSWCALRRYQGEVRLTLYLALEAKLIYAPGTIPAPTADCSALLGRTASAN